MRLPCSLCWGRNGSCSSNRTLRWLHWSSNNSCDMRRPLLCVVDVWNLLRIVPPRTPEEVSSQGKKNNTPHQNILYVISEFDHCDCRMRHVIIAWFTVVCIGVPCVKNTGRWRIISLMQMLHLQLPWILLQFKRWTPKREKTLLHHRLPLHLPHLPKANTMISRWSLYRKTFLLNSAAYAR